MELTEFRLFEEAGPIRFAPVTIILGRNSSGKTSLLRAPLLFRQLLTAQSVTGEAPLSGPTVDFGAYSDLVRDGDRRRDVTLSFRFWIDPESPARRFFESSLLTFNNQTLHVVVTLHWNKRNGRAQIQRLSFVDEGGDTLAAVERVGPNAVRLQMPTLNTTSTLEGIPEISLRTLDLLPSGARAPGNRGREASFLIYGITTTLQDAFRRLRYIPPIREMPERVYRLDQAASANSLSYQTIATLSRDSLALREAAAGLRHLEIAEDVSLKNAAQGLVNIMLTMPNARKINLADVGFGASQVLPILVSLASATPGTMMLIEQPELHLHPQAQVALADILVDAAISKGLSLVLETHSEHMFLRVRRRLAEGRLDRGSLAAYVVDRARTIELQVDDRGRMDTSGFPPNFFEEDWTEALELAKALSAAAT